MILTENFAKYYLKKKDTIIQFVKYGFIGGLNTAITLAIYFFMTNCFQQNKNLSDIIGYVVGLINSYILNKLWTFKSKGNLLKETFLFLLVFIIAYSPHFLIFNLLQEKINHNIAQIISAIIYTIIGFIGNKLLTFKPKN